MPAPRSRQGAVSLMTGLGRQMAAFAPFVPLAPQAPSAAG